MRPGFQQDFTVAAFNAADLQVRVGISQRLGDLKQRYAMCSQ
jgi:hypothetical protein